MRIIYTSLYFDVLIGKSLGIHSKWRFFRWENPLEMGHIIGKMNHGKIHVFHTFFVISSGDPIATPTENGHSGNTD